MPVKRLVNVDRAMLGDAAHRHAGMLRLDHHGNAAGLQHLVDRGRDLGGQMLLGLQAAREDVGQPRQLRQSHHPLDRRIGDMRPAVERHHVMLALRGEFDVADQHEIVIAGGLAEGAVEHLRRALMIALIELVEGLDHAARRIQQALALAGFRRYSRAASAPPLPPRRATDAAGRRGRRRREIRKDRVPPDAPPGSSPRKALFQKTWSRKACLGGGI